jgi:hypothetical protein
MENNETFEYDAGEPKEKQDQAPVIKKQLSTRFKAILKGQRLLKEGGLQVTLDIPETNRDSVKQMLDMTNMELDVFVIASEPETFGGNV